MRGPISGAQTSFCPHNPSPSWRPNTQHNPGHSCRGGVPPSVPPSALPRAHTLGLPRRELPLRNDVHLRLLRNGHHRRIAALHHAGPGPLLGLAVEVVLACQVGQEAPQRDFARQLGQEAPLRDLGIRLKGRGTAQRWVLEDTAARGPFPLPPRNRTGG